MLKANNARKNRTEGQANTSLLESTTPPTFLIGRPVRSVLATKKESSRTAAGIARHRVCLFGMKSPKDIPTSATTDPSEEPRMIDAESQ